MRRISTYTNFQLRSSPKSLSCIYLSCLPPRSNERENSKMKGYHKNPLDKKCLIFEVVKEKNKDACSFQYWAQHCKSASNRDDSTRPGTKSRSSSVHSPLWSQFALPATSMSQLLAALYWAPTGVPTVHTLSHLISSAFLGTFLSAHEKVR